MSPGGRDRRAAPCGAASPCADLNKSFGKGEGEREGERETVFQADCKLKVNRGLAKKRKPHDSCFANKHLNNEELSWGKNTLPKLTEKS